MSEKKIEARWNVFNVFNLTTAALGWFHTHTFTGAFWGWVIGTVGVPVFFMAIILAVVLGHKALNAIADAVPTRVRIAENFRVETDEQRWEREYAEHCKEQGIPNELGVPIRQADDHDFTVSSSTYYTSGGGPG